MVERNMQMYNRREFLGALAGVGVTSAAFRAWCAEHGADFDFASAAAECGWDPTAKDAFYFLHASDLHMTENPDWDRGALQMKDKFMGRCFIDDINAMNALPQRPSVLFLTGSPARCDDAHAGQCPPLPRHYQGTTTKQQPMKVSTLSQDLTPPLRNH